MKPVLFKIMILSLPILIARSGYGQQGNNWYFGDSAGISFNATPPAALTNGRMNTSEGCATISDNSGKLLFYTDGITVWNRLQGVMPNGTGLKGDPSSSNSAIVIPKPGSNTIYYIFTADAGENNNAKGYNYSEVDMTLNGGLGDITANKNILLYAPSSEQLTAIRDANGIDIWVVTKVWGNNEWQVYKVDCNGVNTVPVSSFAGLARDSIWNVIIDGNPGTQNVGSAGCLKASADGKRIATTTTISNYWEIFNFDNATGIISAPLDFPQNSPYGLEFSPDSKLLYIVSEALGYYSGRIMQYDLAVYDSLSIATSGVNVGDGIPFIWMGGIQAGPDNKIYCAEELDTVLGVINSPNTPGTGCNFNKARVGLKGKMCLRSLPVFFPSLITNQNAGFTYTVNSDCSTVDFSGSSTVTGTLTWSWDFGDGFTATGQNVTHVFASPGPPVDTVRLTVTTSTHCGSAISLQPVNLTRITPLAHFGFALQCGNPSVSFMDSSTISGSAILSWLWDFGDGVTSMQQSPTHVYTNYGNYAVKLSVTSAGVCNGTDIAQTSVPIEAKPVAAFANTRTCAGESVTFTDQSSIASGSITQWYWDFGEGTHSVLQDPDKVFALANTFTIRLAAISSSGCVSDTLSKVIAVSSLHIDSISVMDTCFGSATQFSGAAKVINDQIAGWWWDLGTGNGPATQNASQLYPAPGQYHLRLAASGNSGCLSDTLSRPVTIRSKPQAGFTADNGCIGSLIPLQNNATDADGSISGNYWDFGDGDHAASSAPSYSYTQFGDFTIRHLAISNSGCLSDTVSQTVNIQSVPKLDFRFGNTCVGKEVQFSNLSANDSGQVIQWNWNFGNGDLSHDFAPSTAYTHFGNYPVQLAGSTSNGCAAHADKEIVISNVNVSAGPDTTVAAGQPLQLQASGALDYVWTPPTGLDDPNSEHPVADLQKNVVYYLTGTTAQGCKGYDTLRITVYKEPDIYVPNAFTPNGDGHNDILRPILAGISEYYYFSVYNRYGQLVFTTRTPGAGWDGKIGGSDAAQGVYVWMLKAKNYLGKMVEKRGTVILVR